MRLLGCSCSRPETIIEEHWNFDHVTVVACITVSGVGGRVSVGAGPSIGDKSEGVGRVGGMEGERIGEVLLTGASDEAINIGVDIADEGEDRIEVSDAGEGTGGGDLMNNSVGRRTFSILKMDIGTESR
ncbi:hypothetical protein L6452_11509 [Arctium lappa]|uniref:Uncharacterized protein n=1 Tax=Arctium lappa TaxID=4217 RepID=A0ACB9DQ61_ARCLA|nr:hypothetical protein L6452_11509 [Arctium lappa]